MTSTFCSGRQAFILVLLLASTAFAHEEATAGISSVTVGHIAVILITVIAAYIGLTSKAKNKAPINYIVLGIILIGLFHLTERLLGESFEPIEHDAEHVLNFVSIGLIGLGLYKIRK